MKNLVMCAALLAALASDALATDARGAADQPRQTQTETWLQLQAKGSAASSIPQTSTPAERDLSLQRWLDSYKHEIPPFYDQEAGGKISSGK
ncbi:hypothetical protein BZK31_16020 [Pseudomonas floridensis]|uniref:DUF3613 domain-containing protein n=1 Tax=Pseudomonas floridensis TaxID=1958950 RepID=A0A1X0N495_9PSED|nr:DUF3613 domain-containing protein [Pseudomonas floridensis]ORC58221.1 hypothetical protein BZK31_16020 [Pseudomonas floridensis]